MDNLPRVLPKKCDAVIRKGAWDVLPIFQLLARHGDVSERELYQVFNMGIGMVAIVAGDQTAAVLKSIRARHHSAWVIGEITAGNGKCRII